MHRLLLVILALAPTTAALAADPYASAFIAAPVTRLEFDDPNLKTTTVYSPMGDTVQAGLGFGGAGFSGTLSQDVGQTSATSRATDVSLAAASKRLAVTARYSDYSGLDVVTKSDEARYRRDNESEGRIVSRSVDLTALIWTNGFELFSVTDPARPPGLPGSGIAATLSYDDMAVAQLDDPDTSGDATAANSADAMPDEPFDQADLRSYDAQLAVGHTLRSYSFFADFIAAVGVGRQGTTYTHDDAETTKEGMMREANARGRLGWRGLEKYAALGGAYSAPTYFADHGAMSNATYAITAVYGTEF